WDLSGQLLADLKHESWVSGAIFSADGNSILTHSYDGTAKLWDLSGQLLADLKHEDWVSGAIFSADGNSILTHSSDGTAKLWFTPHSIFELLSTARIPFLSEEDKKAYNIPPKYR
ncbi:MAG: hypothetical protein F6K19_40005, partial [Cyanothece sp. SIO1E1]|nr:hypothetical protein [Cyanothece sp. SIO1E1]